MRDEIRKMLDEEHTNCEYEESLIDRVEELVSRSYAEGYSFCKNESSLVEKAAESLSD